MPTTPKLTRSLRAKLRGVRHVALDMDGTIYRGNTIFPFTLRFLTLLDELQIGYTFLTNNPSKNNADYHTKIRRMGIHVKPEQLYTSAQATIEFLRRKFSTVKKLFVLGTPSMKQTFVDAGYKLLRDDPKAKPDAVVVGFDPTMTYSGLCRAAWWIQNGVPYFATNPDAVCPTDESTVLVDCGSITVALEKATGIAPTAVLGKPDVSMLHGILRRHSLKPHEVAMVGDRLYTDVALARRAGALGVLVLTGETTAKQAAASRPKPDLVMPTLSEFGGLLVEVSDK